MQVLDKEAIQHEAKLIAFDRQNHMGVSEKVASRLEEAIVREAEALKKPGGAKSVISIKANEDRLKELKVRAPGETGVWGVGEQGGCTLRGEETCAGRRAELHRPAAGICMRPTAQPAAS